MKYKWILFDADGTLFDYDRAEITALRATFVQAGLPFQPEYAQAYRAINAAIWKDFEEGKISARALRVRRFEELFNAIQVQADPITFSKRYLQNLADGTELTAHAEKTVKALHERVQLLIITNGLTEVQRPRLERSAISGYFSDIIISDEVGCAKPDKRIFDIAFDRMNHPHKTEVLIVGDSVSADMKGGYNYGIDTCWFNPEGKPRPDGIALRYEIRDLCELVKLLEVS